MTQTTETGAMDSGVLEFGWSLKTVIARTGFGKTTIYRLMDEAKFPKPYRAKDGDGNEIGPQYWLPDEVRNWMRSNPRKR